MQLDHVCFTVIDTETTGLDPSRDAVVEIACWGFPSEALRFPPHAELVRPPIPIPPTASAIHHLVDADVAQALPLEEVWGRFWTTREPTDCWVAHNAPFDQAFLSGLPGTDKPWLDTQRLARHLWPEAPGYSNQVLRYWLQLPVATQTAHRAADDVRVTMALLCRELFDYSQLDQPQTLEGLLAFINAPIPIPAMPFGKHKGVLLCNLPRSYLQWVLVNVPGLDPDLRKSLEDIWKGVQVG